MNCSKKRTLPTHQKMPVFKGHTTPTSCGPLQEADKEGSPPTRFVGLILKPQHDGKAVKKGLG
jgi:hypothetical protein